MNADGSAALDRYRTLWNRAESLRRSIESIKVRLKEQLDAVTRLEAAARKLKVRYQQLLKEAPADQDRLAAVKTELAGTEANLTEARGLLQGLENELPRLQAQVPSGTELDHARRVAWEAIWMDLRSQVSPELQRLVLQSYAALLMYKTDASYATALSSLFSDPPTRQECRGLAEEIALQYEIPLWIPL